MQTQEAKTLSLPELLARLQHKPVKQVGSKFWYLSPFRNETKPSFCVEPGQRVAWIFSDHGANIRGNILDFVMHYRKCSLKAALDWLDQVFNYKFCYSDKANFQPKNSINSTFVISQFKPIQHPALIEYLETRAIGLALARLYLFQIHYLNNKNRRFALAWKNDSGGWNLRNKYFKGAISPMAISTIGSFNGSLAIFEGMFDFLAALSFYNTSCPRGQVIILNSLNNLNSVFHRFELEKYQVIKLFLDNDTPGRVATKRFLALKNCFDYSSLFAPAKDFSLWFENLTTNQ